MPGPAQQPGSPRRVLWVEGKDDKAVVQSLCNQHRLPPAVFRVDEKQGLEPILAGLSVELRAPNVERFGVVVDGNGNPDARWDSIRVILESHGYSGVPQTLQSSGIDLPSMPGGLRFGVWIMPDNGSPGVLEDFAAALVPAGDQVWKRAGEAVDGIPAEHRRFPEVRRSKAHIHTWLAWQEYPGSPMGQAIGKGDLDAHAPAAGRFVAWLRRLMLDDPDAGPE